MLYVPSTISEDEVAFVELCLDSACEPVVFDVGAAYGNYSFLVKSLWPNAELHIFEPRPETIIHLKDNFENVNSLAVSDKNGYVPFVRSPEEMQEQSFITSPAIGMSEGDELLGAEAITISDYCLQHSIERIGLLKIDTEGHEPAVILGAGSMITDSMIDAVQFEYGSTWKRMDKDTLFNICDLMRDSGYSLLEYQSGDWVTYNPEEDYIWRNVYCVLKG